jgi:hypothetical protein
MSYVIAIILALILLAVLFPNMMRGLLRGLAIIAILGVVVILVASAP